MKNLEFSENDWHYKLIKFTWSLEPSSIKSLCPYFWLTVASVFCCPVAAIGKVGKKIWSGLKRLQERYYIKGLSKAQLYWFYITSGISLTDETKSDRYRGCDFFRHNDWNVQDFKKKTGLGEKEIMAYREEYLKEVERLEGLRKKRKEKEKEESKEDFMETVENITEVTKGLLKIALLALIFFLTQVATAGLTVLFSYCIYGKDFNPGLIYAVGGALMVGLVIILIGHIIQTYENEWKENLRSIPLFWLIPATPIFLVYIPLRYLCLGVWWLFGKFIFGTVILGILRGFIEGFMEFGGIFSEYLNASYSDYCPMIKWKNDGED